MMSPSTQDYYLAKSSNSLFIRWYYLIFQWNKLKKWSSFIRIPALIPSIFQEETQTITWLFHDAFPSIVTRHHHTYMAHQLGTSHLRECLLISQINKSHRSDYSHCRLAKSVPADLRLRLVKWFTHVDYILAPYKYCVYYYYYYYSLLACPKLLVIKVGGLGNQIGDLSISLTTQPLARYVPLITSLAEPTNSTTTIKLQSELLSSHTFFKFSGSVSLTLQRWDQGSPTKSSANRSN